jgi:hypothetical protein
VQSGGGQVAAGALPITRLERSRAVIMGIE